MKEYFKDKSNIEDIYSLSDYQLELIFSSIKFSNIGLYHVQNLVNFNIPDFNLDVFKKAVQYLVDKHQILRLGYNIKNKENPIQIVYKKVEHDIKYIDISTLNKNSQEDSIRSTLEEDKRRPFNFNNGKVLWRIIIWSLGEDSYYIAWIKHHSIIDGWSTASLFTELNKNYLMLLKNPDFKATPLKSTYKDYIIKLILEKENENKKHFWIDELVSFNKFNFFDKQLPEQFDQKYYFEKQIKPTLTKKIKVYTKASKVSIKAICLTAYLYGLSLFSYAKDFTIGIAINNRMPTPDGEKILGYFVNILPYRYRPGKRLSWKELVIEVNNKLLEIEKYKYVSHTELIRYLNINNSVTNPFFDIVFNYIDYFVYDDLLGNNSGISNNITLSDNTSWKQEFHISGNGNNLIVSMVYTKDNEPIINTLYQNFVSVLEKIISTPEHQVSSVPFITNKNQLPCFEGPANHSEDYKEKINTYGLFLKSVENNPNNIAVEQNGKQISYKELKEKSDRLANLLIERGAKEDSIVGIFLGNSIDFVASVLGVLKLGAIYVPIDLKTPEKRIEYIIKDTDLDFLVTNNDILDKSNFQIFDGFNRPVYEIVKTKLRPQISNLDKIQFIDRSLIDIKKYNSLIGQAPVKNRITLQATRGCPYKCLYCHKIWSKKHVFRSAENIFEEVKYYYDLGIRNFSFIDDIFNLNKKNSTWFFELVIENGLDIHIYFPNGLRGDILTFDYIDLMVEAGTRGISLALETASPRIQKLIKKNLDIDKLHQNLEYFCEKHPEVIIDLFTMHGFPGETEEEALMTLDFIKSIKWLHFPYINIVKIYSNTDLYNLALDMGIDREDILRSEHLAHHELSKSHPFSKEFTLKYQTTLLNEYFLNKERLLHVLPYQMKILSEDEIVQKYNSYLPVNIKNFDELLDYLGIKKTELSLKECHMEDHKELNDLQKKMEELSFGNDGVEKSTNLLLIDLSQSFQNRTNLYNVVEPPLGLMYLLSNLDAELKKKANGKIIKSGIDFNSYEELSIIINTFKPNLIGVRTIIFHRHFFHKSVSQIKKIIKDVPIIAGGPYPTSNYNDVIKDGNIDIVVLGEGEITFNTLLKLFVTNDNKIPKANILRDVEGIVFKEKQTYSKKEKEKSIIRTEDISEVSQLNYSTGKNENLLNPKNAYIIYTSGSTGKPKGTLVSHKNLLNYINFSRQKYTMENGRVNFPLFTSISFDLTITSIFTPLVTGGKIIIPKGIEIDEQLKDIFTNREVDTVKLTPSHLKILEHLKINDSGVSKLLVGGEQLETSLCKDISKKFNEKIQIYNEYGPTETTVGCMIYEYKKEDDVDYNVPIGEPIHNTQIYLLDRFKEPLVSGAKGELYIAGSGVSLGYINKPETTQESFYSSSSALPKKLYKTGDLARTKYQNIIEFVDRIDDQIKIHGYRIELSEIEIALKKLDRISDATIKLFQNNDDKFICAYYVTDFEIESEDIKEELSEFLPMHMLPVFYIQLASIPLTLNGKVNMRALPDPEMKTMDDSTLSLDNEEKELSGLWSEVLGIEVEKIGVKANFFEIGGHSLKVILLLNKIKEHYGIEILMIDIFNHPQLKDLVLFIKSKEQKSVKLETKYIEPAETRDYYPLTSAQQRLFFMQYLDENATIYNMPEIIKLEGNLKKEKLHSSFNELLNRHEIFRSSFILVDEQPVQRIHKNVEIEIIEIEKKDSNLETLIDGFFKPFDLSKPPIMRVGLIKIDELLHYLLIDIHHIVSDAASRDVLINEFTDLYNGKKVVYPKFQYRDYAIRFHKLHMGPELQKQKEYWHNLYSNRIPDLNLVTDFPRSESVDYKAQVHFLELDERITLDIKQLALDTETSTFMLLFAAFNVLLASLTGQEDIIVGSPLINRPSEFSETIGIFLSTIPYRNFPNSQKSFSQFLEEVKKNMLDAYENQHYQFEELVKDLGIKRELGRNPLFDTFFNFIENDANNSISLNELTITSCVPDIKTTKFEIELYVNPQVDKIRINWVSRSNLFYSKTIEEYMEKYENIINKILENLQVKLSDIYSNSKQQLSLVADFNDELE